MDAAMGALGLGIIISLRDQASNGLDKLREKMAGLRDVSENAVKSFDAGARQMLGGFAAMWTGAKILGAAVGSSLEKAAAYQSETAKISTLIDGNIALTNKLSGAVLDMSAKFGQSAESVAAGMYSSISAGVAAAEAPKFLEAATKMAVAGVTDTQTAVSGLTSAIKAYGLSVEQAGDLSDAFFVAMKYGKTTVGELSGIMGGVSSVAANSGIKFDELMAGVAAATLPGQTTSEVGTGMVAAIRAITAPSVQARKTARALGIELNETALRTKGLFGTFQTLIEKTNGSQEALTRLLGSSEATKTVLNAMAGGGQNFINTMDAMREKAGATEAAFKTISDTVQFRLAILDATMGKLSRRFGSVFLPAYGKFLDILTRGANILAGLPEPVFKVIAVVGGLSGAVLILCGALAALGGFVKVLPALWSAVKLGFGTIREQARLAGAALRGVSLPVWGLIGLAGVLYYSWKKNLGGIRDMVTAVSKGFSMALSADENGIARVDAATADRLKKAGIWDFAVEMGRVFYRVRGLWDGVLNGLGRGIEIVKTVLSALDGVIGRLLGGGRGLLEWLGILNPVAESGVQTWRDWGEVIGTFVPVVLSLAAAFKIASVAVAVLGAIKTAVMGLAAAFKIASGAVAVLGAIKTAVMGLTAAILANPVGAAVAVAILGVMLLYNYWDEFSAWFAGIFAGLGEIVNGVFEVIAGAFMSVISLLTLNWKGFVDGLGRIFSGLGSVVKGYIDTIIRFFRPLVELIRWVGEKLGFAGPDLTGVNVNDAPLPAAPPDAGYEGLKRGYEAQGAVFDDGVNRALTDTNPGGNAGRIPDEAKTAPMPAAPLLAQQTRTQAGAAGQAAANAVAVNPRPLEVNNNVKVKVQAATTPVYLNGDKIGEFQTNYKAWQETRGGLDPAW